MNQFFKYTRSARMLLNQDSFGIICDCFGMFACKLLIRFIVKLNHTALQFKIFDNSLKLPFGHWFYFTDLRFSLHSLTTHFSHLYYITI